MTSAPPGDDSPVGRCRAAGWVLAAGLYLLVALFALRVVLPAPRVILPYSAHLEGPSLAIDETDQQFVVASIAHAASRFAQDPTRLFDNGQCHPMARPVTLGEHMFGEGLLGAVPQALVGDPILTYNVVLLLGLWIAGLTMFGLVCAWTGRVEAALVAGFLFAFQPGRIGDPVHPFVHGDLWCPLAMLAAYRLFTGRRWRDAVLLALALGLQVLESLYTLIALAIVGGVYGVALLIRFRRVLPRLALQLVVVAVVVGAVAAAVFVPYLETREAWRVLEGRGGLLFRVRDFAPGAYYYPGTVMVVLALVGAVDRLRGPRRRIVEHDPRLALVVGAVLVFWTVVWGFRVPGTEVFVPSPYSWAAARIPGLRAIRAIPAVRFGLYLCLAALAGWGWLVLAGRLRPRVRRVATAAVLALAFVEVFVPGVNELSAGTGQVRLAERRLAPFPAFRALGARFPAGAVLDVPFRLDPHARLTDMAHFIFRGAYHERPVAACYNSFTVPIIEDVAEIAARVPGASALSELWALGFRTILVHDEIYEDSPEGAAMHRALARAVRGAPRLVPIGSAGLHQAHAIAGEVPVRASCEALEPLGSAAALIVADGDYEPPVATLRLRFRNASATTVRLPDPIEPTPVLARWRGLDTGGSAEEELRLLLPIAVAPGRIATRELALRTPETAGRWRLDIVTREPRPRTFASVEVVVPPPGPERVDG